MGPNRIQHNDKERIGDPERDHARTRLAETHGAAFVGIILARLTQRLVSNPPAEPGCERRVRSRAKPACELFRSSAQAGGTNGGAGCSAPHPPIFKEVPTGTSTGQPEVISGIWVPAQSRVVE